MVFLRVAVIHRFYCSCILYYSAKGVARKSIVRQMERGLPNEDPEEIEGNCLVLFSLYQLAMSWPEDMDECLDGGV